MITNRKQRTGQQHVPGIHFLKYVLDGTKLWHKDICNAIKQQDHNFTRTKQHKLTVISSDDTTILATCMPAGGSHV